MTDINGKEFEWARAPPPSGPIWSRIAKIIYNSEDNSFLGRTPKRWGIVLTFYLVFYAVLAVMFGLCMGGLFYSLDPNKPTYTLHQSLIGANPGLSYRPLPLLGNVVEYSVNNSTFELYAQEVHDFIEPYEKEVWHPEMMECTANDSYGFPHTPCFFIKLNKIFGWMPEYYDDVVNLPADMPQDLKDHIKALDVTELKQVWVSCAEESGNSTGIEYPWGRHLLGRVPFQSEAGHLGLLLAVKFTPPVNQLVAIRCRAWAKNIIFNKSLKEPSGYTRILLHIEDNTEEALD